MVDEKITQLTELTTPVTTDIIPIIDDPTGTPVTKYIKTGNLFANGWVADGLTWTYVDAKTFTVSGDVTVTYQKGTFLRWKQGGGWKYGVVASSAYVAPNTTVTIIVNTNYTIANAAITDNGYSYMANPQGWPALFLLPTPTLTSTGVGFTNQPVENVWKVAFVGKIVTIFASLRNHVTASDATGIFIATFPSGTLMEMTDYVLPLGESLNLSTGKFGQAFAFDLEPLIIKFCDSSGGTFDTLAGNGEYYHVQISIPLS